MNEQRRKFVNAYLTTANGNGTKAAIEAGYSEKTAPQIASRLLKQVDVQEALQDRIKRSEFTVDRSLKRIARIADHELTNEQISAKDVLKANELFLDVHGKLGKNNTGQQGSRIVVNIGFLQSATQPSVTGTELPAIETNATSAAQEMASSPQFSVAGDVCLPVPEAPGEGRK